MFQALVEAVRRAADGIGVAHSGEGEALPRPGHASGGGLREAVVEVAPLATGDVGMNAVEHPLAVFAGVEAGVQEMPQHPSRLRGAERQHAVEAGTRAVPLPQRSSGIAQRQQAAAQHRRSTGAIDQRVDVPGVEAAVEMDVFLARLQPAFAGSSEAPARTRQLLKRRVVVGALEQAVAGVIEARRRIDHLAKLTEGDERAIRTRLHATDYVALHRRAIHERFGRIEAESGDHPPLPADGSEGEAALEQETVAGVARIG